MDRITFEEYKNAIKAQYEQKKSEDVSGILLHPTPAQLRNLCVMMVENSLSQRDERTMKLFFNVKEQQTLTNAMAQFDVARFRPIISFLRGEKDSNRAIGIELAAIMIDFNPRPYHKYLLGEKSRGAGENTEIQQWVAEDKSDTLPFAAGKGIEKEAVVNHFRVKKNALLFFTVIVSLFFMGYTVKSVLFPDKECMMWQGNHYEVVECRSETSGVANFTPVVALDQGVLSLRKIEVNRTTEFFKNGKPALWYGKSAEGNYEYFNKPGLHPVTDKTLKPISAYIIKKYLREY